MWYMYRRRKETGRPTPHGPVQRFTNRRRFDMNDRFAVPGTPVSRSGRTFTAPAHFESPPPPSWPGSIAPPVFEEPRA